MPATDAGKPKALQRKKLQKLKEKNDKRGVVYISRLPPHLVRAAAATRPLLVATEHWCSPAPLHLRRSR